MSYKNSVKLLTSNFSIVWKQLLYMLSVCLVCFLLAYGVAQPVIETLKNEGIVAEFTQVFETIYTAPKDIFNALSNVSVHFTEVLTANFGKLWLSIFATFLFGPVVYQILKNSSMYNVSSIMYMKMTSFVDIGYTRNMISTLWQSIRYAFAKLIYQIPFAMLKILLLYCYFTLAKSALSILFGLFFFFLFLVLISAIETTLFSAMAGKMLDTNGKTSAFKAFFVGNVVTFKQFARIFSNALIVVLTLILVNAFLGLFTLGVALLITLPASLVFVSIFELCAYFGAKGERYYLSSTVIATPVKGENESINKK